MTTMTRRSILGVLGAAPLATGLGLATDAFAPPHADRPRPRHIPDDLRPGGALDRLVAEMAARDAFSGSLLLTYQGRTVLARSHGMADAELERPNRPDTVFALGSLNKLFTAVAVAQLAQQARVRFDAQLGVYLDGFPSEIADRVTVHHLLTHTSGLGDHMQAPGFLDAARSWTSPGEAMAGTIEAIRGMEPGFPPGAGHTYSNAAFCLAGAIVERVSGQSYYDYVRHHVFEAAGMRSTDFITRPDWQTNPRIAHPYARQPSGERADVVDDKPFIGSPAGDAFSTCADMERFAHALLGDRGDGRLGGLLEPAYRQLVLSGKTPMPPPGPPPAGEAAPPAGPQRPVAFQCYGPIGQLLAGHWAFVHAGGAPGTSTSIEIYPDHEWVAVVLSNYDADTVTPIARLARDLINTPGDGDS